MEELVRFPAVAGTFYPAARAELDALLTNLLTAAKELLTAAKESDGAGAMGRNPRRPKAIVVPHAGYAYSGPIAAAAFARLAAQGERIQRVVLLGPAHRVPVDGLASPGVSRMRTPLGDMPVDLEALAALPEIHPNAMAHAREHSLEVELPFLQKIAPQAKVVPLAVGRAEPARICHVLETLWGGPETVIVVSSDLSHDLPYDAARAADRKTADRVVALDRRPIGGEDACGATGINGMILAARDRQMHVELVDLRNSGDTAGSRAEVVGYGAFALYETS